MLIAAACLAAALAVDYPRAVRAAEKQGTRGTAVAERVVPTPSRPPARGLDDALKLAYQCRAIYARLDDYTARFLKRERLGDELSELNHIDLKVRRRPFSVYMRWAQPSEGREALYVEGQRGGKLLAHDTGVTRFFTGTMELDPTGSIALRASRHPITEAGIGNLIERVIAGWEQDRRWGNTEATVIPGAQVHDRKCWCIQTRHAVHDPRLQTYRVRMFVDERLTLPIRIEVYDWPRRGGPPDGEVIEEYTYLNLRLNQRLTDVDFRSDNPAYGF